IDRDVVCRPGKRSAGRWLASANGDHLRSCGHGRSRVSRLDSLLLLLLDDAAAQAVSGRPAPGVDDAAAVGRRAVGRAVAAGAHAARRRRRYDFLAVEEAGLAERDTVVQLRDGEDP